MQSLGWIVGPLCRPDVEASIDGDNEDTDLQEQGDGTDHISISDRDGGADPDDCGSEQQ